MSERPSLCNDCKDKACQAYLNEDGECHFHPGQEALVPAIIELAKATKEDDEEED